MGGGGRAPLQCWLCVCQDSSSSSGLECPEKPRLSSASLTINSVWLPQSLPGEGQSRKVSWDVLLELSQSLKSMLCWGAAPAAGWILRQSGGVYGYGKEHPAPCNWKTNLSSVLPGKLCSPAQLQGWGGSSHSRFCRILHWDTAHPRPEAQPWPNVCPEVQKNLFMSLIQMLPKWFYSQNTFRVLHKGMNIIVNLSSSGVPLKNPQIYTKRLILPGMLLDWLWPHPWTTSSVNSH